MFGDLSIWHWVIVIIVFGGIAAGVIFGMQHRQDNWDDLEKLAHAKEPKSPIWRTVGIWLSGLFAAMIVGGGIGGKMTYNGEFMGALGGIATFTMARLWLARYFP